MCASIMRSIGKFDAAVTSKAGARALTITGRILEESEKRYREAKPSKTSMVWVTRGGRALQTLLTISTPGGLPHAVFRHWLGLLYIFEVLLVLGALALSGTCGALFRPDLPWPLQLAVHCREPVCRRSDV